MLTTLGRGLQRLLRDERGAEGLEKLLIIGAIVLPLLGVLIFFRESITELLRGRWSDMSDEIDPPAFQP